MRADLLKLVNALKIWEVCRLRIELLINHVSKQNSINTQENAGLYTKFNEKPKGRPEMIQKIKGYQQPKLC